MFLAVFNVVAALVIGILVLAVGLSMPGTSFKWSFWAAVFAVAIVLFATFLTGIGD